MSFGMMVQNDTRKANFDSQKIWSKDKITGQGHRGQKPLKKTLFKLLPRYFKQLLTDFDELWQGDKKRSLNLRVG